MIHFLIMKQLRYSIHCLLNDNKSAQKVWSKDLVHEKTIRLSSRTTHDYKIS